MNKFTFFSALLIALFLGGCQLTHVEGNVDGVNIRATTNDGGHHGSNGKFCPPGQAKKGNC